MPLDAYSPADVVRKLLIDLGLGTDPALGQGWPVFAEGEPPTPDDCITVYTTAGVDSPRTQYDGEQNGTEGFQVRVRCTRHREGYVKADTIKDALNAPSNTFRRVVDVEGADYLVHAIDRLSNVISLGKESPNSRRALFTLNGQLMSDRM